jgi:hypothetical protein
MSSAYAVDLCRGRIALRWVDRWRWATLSDGWGSVVPRLWPNRHREVRRIDDLHGRPGSALRLDAALAQRILHLGEAIDLTRTKVDRVRYGRVATVCGVHVIVDSFHMVFSDDDDLGRLDEGA